MVVTDIICKSGNEYKLNFYIPYMELMEIGIVVENCDMETIPWMFIDELPKISYFSVTNTNLNSIDKIFTSSKLKELNLTSNQISSIADHALLRCENLEIVDFSNNVLTSVPPCLYSRTTLKYVDLSHNKIKNISRELFTSNSEINTINFQYNSLEEVSLNDFKYSVEFPSTFNVINLSNNFLQKVESADTEAISVTILDLSNNLLTTLDLTNIRIANIIVNSNYLKNLTIGYDCKELFAKNNEISDLSINASCSTLRTLDLNYNKLGDNINSICECVNLQVIYLIHNQIRNIGFCFGKMKSLEEVNLSRNQLYKLDYGYLFLEYLEKLDLSYNKFRDIDKNMWLMFRNLRYLYLDGNQLENLPDNLDTLMPNLVMIGLSHNRFPCEKLILLYTRLRDTSRIAFNVDDPYPDNVTNIRGITCYRNNVTQFVVEEELEVVHVNISDTVILEKLQQMETNKVTSLWMKKERKASTVETSELTTEEYIPVGSTGRSIEDVPKPSQFTANTTSSTLEKVLQTVNSLKVKLDDLRTYLTPVDTSNVQQRSDFNIRTFVSISLVLVVLAIALAAGVLWYNFHWYCHYKKIRENRDESMRTFPSTLTY
ncbi:hypothetical protein DMENIID0001_088310 [Sergentomyia squamirostris]